MMEEGEIVFEAQGEGKSGLSAGELLRYFIRRSTLRLKEYS